MKNIVYFHGLSSSGNSRTGNQLMQLFPDANVITPDIPVHPSEALPKLRELLAKLDPEETIVVGTSMGGMYAQQMHGFRRILVNPGFHVSNHLKEALGETLPFFSPREDGAAGFTVTEELVNEFLEMEARQFDGAGGDVVALFGTKDTTVNCKEEYLKYYTDFRDFDGEHRLTPENVEKVVAPLIREKLQLEEIDEDQKAQDAFDNPAELYRLWQEEGNLLAGQFLGNKHHWGDEENGIFINPAVARKIYEEIGEDYETWENEPDEPDPKTCDYLITGSSGELEGVKLLIDELTELFGMPGNEFGLYLPVGVLMKVMVGSPYYEGNILYMKSESPEKLVITAELEKPHALLYAFREAFTNLNIDMQNIEM